MVADAAAAAGDGASTVAAASLDMQVHDTAESICVSDFNDNASAGHPSTIPDADVSDQEQEPEQQLQEDATASTTTSSTAPGSAKGEGSLGAVQEVVRRALNNITRATGGEGAAAAPAARADAAQGASASAPAVASNVPRLPDQSRGFAAARGRSLLPPAGHPAPHPLAPGSLSDKAEEHDAAVPSPEEDPAA